MRGQPRGFYFLPRAHNGFYDPLDMATCRSGLSPLPPCPGGLVMTSETWTTEDQALLTELLSEATDALTMGIKLANQLLTGEAPDEAQRAQASLEAHERGMIAARALKPLADKALRCSKRGK